ncbi:PEFG-CTERM sorting domain-containing protein, partial [Nitrosopumilus sp.]|uniref:PEFG-CTERM sorting domain-containing protein n=1 Tax=Nitrosopumilus sp. TaxID=2024843 RepID=UPI00260A4535
MNFKRSTTSMAIVLMAVSLISVTSIQQDAFAQSLGMSITATADKGSDTIMVTGKTISDITDITFRVTSPSGNNVVALGQISPDANGDFATEFKIGPLWKENGFYEITAMQGVQQNSLYTLNVLVEVTDGMAERTSVTESNLETGLLGNPEEPNVAMATGLELDMAQFVNGSDEFTVSGITDRVSQDITITIVAPNGNVVTVAQISPSLDGEFEKVITVGGPLWKENGFYTVNAKQFDDPLYTDSIEVDILDGTVVPEFGTIAAMILAVAIISIIAISAKSRLSIMPRY